MKSLRNLYIKYIIGGAKLGADTANKAQFFEQKSEMLRYFTLHSTESGISDQRLCEHEVIVTLTTFGRRLYDVYLTIESIMQGSLCPNRIILWIAEDMRGKVLPVTLQKQMARGLEIEYTTDIRSYKKLVPTLVKYPDAVCVTIDDDIIYNFDLLENLIKAYNEDPCCIHACRVHHIKVDNNGYPVHYNDWDWGAGSEEATKYNFATGAGGILYPPHSLSPDVTDSEAFTRLSPMADDVWFYAMALLNGYRVKKCFTRNSSGEDYIQNDSVQAVSLNSTNVAQSKNDGQIKAVFQAYGIYDILKSDLK